MATEVPSMQELTQLRLAQDGLNPFGNAQMVHIGAVAVTFLFEFWKEKSSEAEVRCEKELSHDRH